MLMFIQSYFSNSDVFLFLKTISTFATNVTFFLLLPQDHWNFAILVPSTRGLPDGGILFPGSTPPTQDAFQPCIYEFRVTVIS